ncbi:MAG: hypothetical protein A2Z19_05305 [Deltaproteobacteria bacterium RBG_16_54_18]|nr:MAG: hypothetical protein A2Z19_05305 [Deltaproteobacteria bacterium RBG_16_54_18]
MVAASRTRPEIEIFHAVHPLAFRDLIYKNLFIDSLCPEEILRPNIDRERHTNMGRIGQFRTMRNARLGKLILQTVNQLHAGSP